MDRQGTVFAVLFRVVDRAVLTEFHVREEPSIGPAVIIDEVAPEVKVILVAANPAT